MWYERVCIRWAKDITVKMIIMDTKNPQHDVENDAAEGKMRFPRESRRRRRGRVDGLSELLNSLEVLLRIGGMPIDRNGLFDIVIRGQQPLGAAEKQECASARLAVSLRAWRLGKGGKSLRPVSDPPSTVSPATSMCRTSCHQWLTFPSGTNDERGALSKPFPALTRGVCLAKSLLYTGICARSQLDSYYKVLGTLHGQSRGI